MVHGSGGAAGPTPTPVEPPAPDPAETCASWVPQDLTPEGRPELLADEAQRHAYAKRRRWERRIFWAAALVLGATSAAGIAMLVTEPVWGSTEWEGDFYIAFVPLAVLGLAIGAYRGVRGRSRVDAFEGDVDAVDTLPPDRLVSPDGWVMWTTVGLLFGVLAAAVPWVVAAISVDEGDLSWTPVVIAACVVPSLALAMAVAWWIVRRLREGVQESPTGLRLRSLWGARDVTWQDVSVIGVQQHDRSTGLSGTAPQLFVWTRSGVWANDGTVLLVASARQRRIARHNIRVAARWSKEHRLASDPGLDAAIRYADGVISASELVAASDAEHQ